MRDLRADLLDLHRQLSQTPATDGGRSVMFMSARAGEGVSSIAASFALMAAEQRASRSGWSISTSSATTCSTPSPSARLPRLSAASARHTLPRSRPNPSSHRAGRSRSHRRSRPLHRPSRRRDAADGDAVRRVAREARPCRPHPHPAAYWQAVRAATDWAVVDAPALELAGAGLAIASQIDRTVIVVRADETTPGDVDAVAPRDRAPWRQGGRRGAQPRQARRPLRRPARPMTRPVARWELAAAAATLFMFAEAFLPRLLAPAPVDATGEIPESTFLRYLWLPFYGCRYRPSRRRPRRWRAIPPRPGSSFSRFSPLPRPPGRSIRNCASGAASLSSPPPCSASISPRASTG